MIYLEKFIYPSSDQEFDYIIEIKRKCYSTYYPFQVIATHQPLEIDFEPITILYGGNGSGKTTALNIIAQKLKLKRTSAFNGSNFYDDYLDLCDYRLEDHIPETSAIITSDDVFDFALNVRHINQGIDRRREEMFDEYLEAKFTQFQMKSLDDYEQLKLSNQAKSKTQSMYVKGNLGYNIKSNSNGENALKYFREKVTEDALFLLDEPENSLSPEKQLELKKFIEESARYCGCQIIMATHSPFLLSIEGAKIYNLDNDPVEISRWTELPHIRTYMEFFKDYMK